MKRLLAMSFGSLLTIFLIFSCNTIKNIPTNTTGGLFSLNGNWHLSSTTDGKSMVGTTITVYPVLGNASVKTLDNNSYCVRTDDPLWKNVKANGNGGFNISTLVSACNGTMTYKDGVITVINKDKVTVTSRTATNTELIQAWDRDK